MPKIMETKDMDLADSNKKKLIGISSLTSFSDSENDASNIKGNEIFVFKIFALKLRI
jgi:hypothetical protein